MLVSTQYLLSIYTVSTRYLHSSGVHGVSTVPGVETAASVSCAATAGGRVHIHLHSGQWQYWLLTGGGKSSVKQVIKIIT